MTVSAHDEIASSDCHDALGDSDKNYWHQYLEFYERELSGLRIDRILEFGVWRGASIRWLHARYPNARIFGIDILPIQASWPVGPWVSYIQMNQGDETQISKAFIETGGELDLIIEDGSHIPRHQRNCLVASIAHLRSGGVYILEDIHTSHPRHPMLRRQRRFLGAQVGSLHLLLAFQHLHALHRELPETALQNLAKTSLFNREEIEYLFQRIESIKIFRRSSLPIRCFACGSDNFDYRRLRCDCGVELYSETDSITALLRVV